MLAELIRGIIRQGTLVNIAVAATPAALYQVSNNANQIGTKSFKLKKVMARNNGGGAIFLSLGTGLGGAFAAVLPPVMLVNNMDNEWQEVEIPNVEFFVDLTATLPVLAAGSVDIMVEVEEMG